LSNDFCRENLRVDATIQVTHSQRDDLCNTEQHECPTLLIRFSLDRTKKSFFQCMDRFTLFAYLVVSGNWLLVSHICLPRFQDSLSVKILPWELESGAVVRDVSFPGIGLSHLVSTIYSHFLVRLRWMRLSHEWVDRIPEDPHDSHHQSA